MLRTCLLEFLVSAWMYFAVVMACVMTYGVSPLATGVIVGLVVGFFIGRHYEYMQPARFRDS